MEENKPKSPMNETTKDDSSDVERVKGRKQPSPPPQPKTEPDTDKEEEEAEKGHS